MKRILLALRTGAAEAWLIGPTSQLARETGAEVTVLAVDDVESQRFEALPRGETLESARRTARGAADRLAEAGVAAEALGRSGAAVATTIEFAREIDADLIVVGSSGTAGVVSRLLGSFPLDLVQKADRQVMVVTDPGSDRS